MKSIGISLFFVSSLFLSTAGYSANTDVKNEKISYKNAKKLAKKTGSLWAQSRICKFEKEGFKESFYSYIDLNSYKEKRQKKIEKIFDNEYLGDITRSVFDKERSKCPGYEKEFQVMYDKFSNSNK